MKNNELTFYISDSNEINFNTHLLKDRKDVIVDQKKLSLGVPDFTVYDSEIIENPTDLPQILSQSKRAKPLVLYYRQENIVKNNSFEADLWNKKVFNCNRYDENPQIHMSRTKDFFFRWGLFFKAKHSKTYCLFLPPNGESLERQLLYVGV